MLLHVRPQHHGDVMLADAVARLCAWGNEEVTKAAKADSVLRLCAYMGELGGDSNRDGCAVRELCACIRG